MKRMRETVDHVRVCCRVRPLNATEKQMHRDLCISFPEQSDDAIDCFVPLTGSAAVGGGSCNSNAPLSTAGMTSGGRGEIANEVGNAGRHSFTFSHVFDPNAGQADVYEHVARPIVDDVLSGYNGTILVYGQTGSGKTHTMFGDPNGGAWVAEGESPRQAATTTLHRHHMNDAEEGRVGDSGDLRDNENGDEQRLLREGCANSTEPSMENSIKQENRLSRCRVSDAGPVDARQVRASSALPSAATLPPAPSSSSSFCRARVTYTPLGELQQINTLQGAEASVEGAKGEQDWRTELLLPSTARGHGKPMAVARANFAGDAVSGIIPRAVHDIFAAIGDADPSTEFDVQMFFVEVYMEQIRDLLAPAGAVSGGFGSGQRLPRKLQLREDVNTNSFYVDGCRNPHVSSADEVLRLVMTGLKQRATSATAMNETSSRSHCLLNLTVKSVNRARGLSTVGKLYLVDLAGSEKVGKTNAKGLRLEEAKLINKSLSTLGLVIMSLTDPSASYTPYRDSVVTKILKDSLGGNSHTALMICCSPSPYNASETLSTLRFGARAKAIENKAIVNCELSATQLQRMLESAKEEIARLHSQLHSCMGEAVDPASGDGPYPPERYSGVAPEVPFTAARKLASAATAAVASGGLSSSRIDELLEERAAEQVRLQNARAEMEQLQDNLNAAQDIIAALQEERDSYIDKVQNYQEEVGVWENGYHAAVKQIQSRDALLQQSAVLLRTQASEIEDLLRCMSGYGAPLHQARQAVDQLHKCLFGADTTWQRRLTLLTAETSQADAATSGVLVSPLESIREVADVDGNGSEGRRSIGIDLADGESPNPRRQTVADVKQLSFRGSRTPRELMPTHGAASPQDGRLSRSSVSVSPTMASAQAWLSTPASDPRRTDGRSAAGEASTGFTGIVKSVTPAAQAECVRRLEEQLASAAAELTAVVKQYKEALAESQSKQRLLNLRGSRLETMKLELDRAYTINRELQEQLENTESSMRETLETARYDANYWRRRYEEVAARSTHMRYSEGTRSSAYMAAAMPPSMPPPSMPQKDRGSGELTRDSGSTWPTHGEGPVAPGAATLLDHRCRLSALSTSTGGPSSRASGEEVLLRLTPDILPRPPLAERVAAEAGRESERRSIP